MNTELPMDTNLLLARRYVMADAFTSMLTQPEQVRLLSPQACMAAVEHLHRENVELFGWLGAERLRSQALVEARHAAGAFAEHILSLTNDREFVDSAVGAL